MSIFSISRETTNFYLFCGYDYLNFFVAKINDFAQDDEHDIMFDDISSDVTPAATAGPDYMSSEEEEEDSEESDEEGVGFYKEPVTSKADKTRKKAEFAVDDVSWSYAGCSNQCYTSSCLGAFEGKVEGVLPGRYNLTQ